MKRKAGIWLMAIFALVPVVAAGHDGEDEEPHFSCADYVSQFGRFEDQGDAQVLAAIQEKPGLFNEMVGSRVALLLGARLRPVTPLPSLFHDHNPLTDREAFAASLSRFYVQGVQRELDNLALGPFKDQRRLQELNGERATNGIVVFAWMNREEAAQALALVESSPRLRNLPRVALISPERPISDALMEKVTRLLYIDGRQLPENLDLDPIAPRQQSLAVYVFGGPCDAALGSLLGLTMAPSLADFDRRGADIYFHPDLTFVEESIPSGGRNRITLRELFRRAPSLPRFYGKMGDFVGEHVGPIAAEWGPFGTSFQFQKPDGHEVTLHVTE